MIRARVLPAARRLLGAVEALRGPRLVLAALGVALVALPLAVHKPGLPPTLKADEPAYFLAALSLVHDFDLKLDEEDQRRLFASYPYLPVNNVIVMTRDGWETLYYGKPFLAPFLATPFVALFGDDGAVVFNMLLFLAMGAMGFAWLRRSNAAGLAAFFVVGFFLLSSGWSYVFWIHPEILCMFATCACLFFGFAANDHLRFVRDGVSGLRWPWVERLGAHKALALSAACLALGVYNKPMLAALGLPVLFELAARRRWRGLVIWMLAAVVSMGAICGVSWALTGAPTPYLVERRAGFNLHDPTRPLMSPEIHEEMFGARPALADAEGEASDSDAAVRAGWWWMFRVPETKWVELREDLVYFFVGRHTGLFVYMPFALLSLLLFLVLDRSRRGWLVLGSLALVAAVFLVWIPFNWHGGGGFVGNRYFVMAYPAFLFLVGRIRPAASVAGFWALAGWLVGPLVLAPFGLVVPSSTLQAHVRNVPHQYLPVEFSLRNLPGYAGTVRAETWLWGRKDEIRALEGPGAPDVVWLRGGDAVDLWLHRGEELRRAVFELRSPSLPQTATVTLGGESREVELGREWTRLEFAAPAPYQVRRDRSPADSFRFIDVYVYRLRVTLERGRFPEWDGEAGPFFPRGAELRFLGESEGVSQ